MQYWYISLNDNKPIINETKYYGTDVDKNRFITHNFFTNKKTAHIYVNRILQTLSTNMEHLVIDEYSEIDLDLPSKTLWANKNVGSIYLNDQQTHGDLIDTYRSKLIKPTNDWYIPTYQQIQELIDNCTITKTNNAIELTSKHNGKKMTLPVFDNENTLYLSTTPEYFEFGVNYLALNINTNLQFEQSDVPADLACLVRLVRNNN